VSRRSLCASDAVTIHARPGPFEWKSLQQSLDDPSRIFHLSFRATIRVDKYCTAALALFLFRKLVAAFRDARRITVRSFKRQFGWNR
jgi:hypothetical protein